MFQLLPCSVCQRTFSLRKDVPEDSLLKCPNCGNQFRLGDVLDAFYGPWIVLDEAGAQPATAATSLHRDADNLSGAPEDVELSFGNLLETDRDESTFLSHRDNAITDDPAELAADDVFDSGDLEDSRTSVDRRELMEDDSLPLALDATLDNEPMTSSTHQFESPMDTFETTKPAVKKMRVRPGDKGGLWSIIQIVLGGAAAIPVTLLLLWYVAGRDVMNAGPTIAQYAPWIVPQKLRQERERVAIQPPGQRVPPPALGEGGFRNFDAELNSPGSATPAAGTSAENMSAPDTSAPDTSGPDTSAADSSAPDATTADADSAAGATVQADQSNLAKTKPQASVRSAPNTPVDDTGMANTFETVRLAKEKTTGWNPAAADKPQMAAALFKDLVRLSEQLSSFPAEGGAIRLIKNDLNDIGRSFKENRDLRLALATMILDQFNGRSQPNSAGRIYLGQAAEVTESDGRWVVHNQSGSTQLKFEVSQQSIPNLKVGQLFFCLGTVLEESPTPTGTTASTIVRISATYFQTL